MIRRALVASIALLAPSVAGAQAYSCAVPSTPLQVHPDLPDANQPQRVVPIGGYTLAITWSPQFCRDHPRQPSTTIQCGGGNRFGFTLHGLWPDGIGKDWPQYCQSTALLPQPILRQQICRTPTAQLIQHEWAKHGTCIAGMTPARFFADTNALYDKLRYPDMDALSRRPLTVGRFAAAMARANPGLTAEMMRVTASKRGWLDEVWICLDKSYAYVRCRAESGGLPANATLRIWRGRR